MGANLAAMRLIMFGLIVSLVACKNEQSAPTKDSAEPAMCTDEPDAGCGSEWCAEHGVPEASCPICNPDAGASKAR